MIFTFKLDLNRIKINQQLNIKDHFILKSCSDTQTHAKDQLLCLDH